MTDKSDYIIPKVLHMVHYYYPSSDQALCHSFVRGSYLLPSQLPGEHTGHKATSRCNEPIWNAHYSSIFHHCQVPILHLGEVRHMWSSHLAQGCYSTAGCSHVSHYGAMPAGWSPIHVLTGLMIAWLHGSSIRCLHLAMCLNKDVHSSVVLGTVCQIKLIYNLYRNHPCY